MAKLVFKVASDWEEVVRLRTEIGKLKNELKGMDSTQSPAAFKTLNTQLSTSTQKMNELVDSAAKAGAEMEGGFKKKIFDASQSVNGLTERIIAQKAVVKDVEADVKRLGDAYRSALKNNPLSANSKLSEYTSAKKALDEEKASLFGLTQQQAEARLSVKKLRDEYSLYKDEAKETVEANNGIAVSWKRALAVIGGATALKAFGSEMIRVRGQFQAADTAIQTLLGSKEKADKLMAQVREYAKISPLEFSDVTSATQMMLGFNIEAEKVPRYLQAIGDVSMGDTQRFNSLTLAFSQMTAAGKLMGQDLNQMINAGFNPLQIMAEKTGKSIATLKDEMSKGAISAEMVQQAFIDATSAGGKFFGMSENASKTINGQLSMMQDAMDSVFNELGQKSEGVIMGSIQMTTSLIENYETIGKVVAGLIATYGAYRTAVMLVTAAESKHTLVEIGLTNVRVLARKAQLALNASMLTNPYVLLAVAVGGLVTTMWALHDATTMQEKEQKRVNDRTSIYNKYLQDEKSHIEQLLSVLQDETKARREKSAAFDELKAKYPSVFAKYETEKQLIENITEARKAENEQIRIRQELMAAKNNGDDVSRLAELKELLKLQTVGEAGRRRQGVQGRWESLYEKYNVRTGKNYFQSDTSYIKDMIAETSSTINAGQNEIRKHERNAWEEHVLSLDKASAEGHKKMLEGYMAILKKSGKEWILLEGEKAPVNAKMLQERISALNGKVLDVEMKDASKFREEAKKAWEKASEDVEAVKNGKRTYKSPEEYEKSLEEAQKKEKAAKKTYEDRGGVTDSSLSNQENQAEKLRKEQDKFNVLLDKQSIEQQRSAEDMQMKVDEARIKAMDEGSAKTIAEMKLNFEKEMQAIDRQKEDAFRKKVEDARAAWEANPKNKGKSFNATDIKLSDDEQNYYDELYKTAIISNEKIYKDLAERYLSYADERLAIEKKFNDDISILQEARKKAETKGDASEIAQIDRSIEKRTEIKNEDIFKLDAEQFKKNMNWEQVFGNLDKVSTDTLKKLKANLKDFISSQKDLSPESLKELVDAIERIDDKVSERDPFETMSISFKSLKEVTDAQREAQKAYNKALEEGTDEEKKNAKATLESAKNSKQKALYEATDALHKGINEIGQYVDAGNQVIGIMETLGMKTPEWLEGTMSGFDEMLNGLGNIDLMKPMSIVTGSLQTIKGALTSITSLGGVINWNGSNAKDVQDSINRLTDRNEALQTSIEDLTDEIKASMGTKSVAAYKDAYEYQKETNENYKKIAQEQARYVGSHHSWNYYWDGFSQNQINDFSRKIGREWNGDIWNLSPEEMKMLRETVDMWEQIQNTGKGGYGDRLTDKLDAYIDQAGKLEELTNALYEGLTGMSFDSMYDSFVDNLMDMKYDAKAAAEDISEYFMRAMLSNKIGELYSDKLEEWWKKFGASMEDNELTEAERKALQDEYMGYVEEAMKLRDELAAATGYDKISQESTSQSASSKGFQAMSQDTGEELNGRFTALQIAGEEIKNQNIIQSQSLNLLTVKADALLSINTETRNIADDTRNLIAQSYLELVQISENTGAIVKPIQQMQRDIAEVKKNAAKL